MNVNFCIKIPNNKNNFKVSLQIILQKINGENFQWEIFGFDGNAKLNSSEDFLSIYSKLSQIGVYKISWQKLIWISENMNQIYDGFFWGYSDKTQF